jgi:hypothetical protein
MKNILFILLLLLSYNSYAQKEKTTANGLTRDQVKQQFLTPKTDEEFYKDAKPNAGFMYKSLQDYYDNKPIPNIRMKHFSSTYDTKGDKVTFVENGVEKKYYAQDLAGKIISTEQGLPVRIQDNRFYILVVDGPICYYWFMQGDVFKSPDGTFTFLCNSEDKAFDYYSMTNTGVISRLENKIYNGWLEKYGLKEQYDNDKLKREMKDSVNDYMNKEKNKLVKYLLLINEKMKSGK